MTVTVTVTVAVKVTVTVAVTVAVKVTVTVAVTVTAEVRGSIGTEAGHVIPERDTHATRMRGSVTLQSVVGRGCDFSASCPHNAF